MFDFYGAYQQKDGNSLNTSSIREETAWYVQPYNWYYYINSGIQSKHPVYCSLFARTLGITGETSWILQNCVWLCDEMSKTDKYRNLVPPELTTFYWNSSYFAPE